jgi:hypothetical protein
MAEKKAVSTMKELAMSFLALVIAIIFTVIAFAIANWAMGAFSITGDLPKAAAIIAVAIILGPTIAAFATKKYF